MRFIKLLLSFLLYSNLFIAACAVLSVQQTGWLLFNSPPDTNLSRFIFFSTICSYSFHYYFTTHSLIPSERISWIQKNRIVLLLLFIAGLAGAFTYLLRLSGFIYWLIPAAIATFMYSAPKIPHPVFRQLRKIAYGKTIFLAFIWMYVTVVLPVIVSGKGWNVPDTLFAASRFFIIYSICILFDYRDREDDKANGVKSLITFLSNQNIDRLFIFSLSFFTILTLGMIMYGLKTSDALILLLPGVVLAALYNLAKKNFSDILYYALLDGLLALSAAILLIARI